MFQNAISHQSGATLVGGGPVNKGDLVLSLSFAPLLVAADGGADAAIAAGRVPDWAIGDLDSISDAARERIGARVIHDTCQNSTDFEKCLARIDAPLILALGFLGGRLDHELAALGTLAQQDRAIILIGEQDVVAHIPRSVAVDLPAGCRVSLFPMTDVTGRSTGLAWPIDDLKFAPAGRSGTSNRATGPIRLSFDQPGMLLMLPRAQLGSLRRALS